MLLVAFCPVSFFLSAVYTESLFLALSVGSIYAARRERWLLCGVLGFLAAISRNGGVALILPTAIIYLYGPRAAATLALTRWAARARRLGPAAAALPAAARRAVARADPRWARSPTSPTSGSATATRWLRSASESVWYRHSTFPLTTIWHGARQAWDGLRQLFQGPVPPIPRARPTPRA